MGLGAYGQAAAEVSSAGRRPFEGLCIYFKENKNDDKIPTYPYWFYATRIVSC